MVEEVKAVLRLRDEMAPGVPIEVGMSTAFGCTLQGTVPEDEVLRLAQLLAQAGVDEIGLSDTTGMANPAQVQRLFHAVIERWPDVTFTAHFHDTRAMGLANALAALNTGVTHFDASLGGLGGCPFAPGASGKAAGSGDADGGESSTGGEETPERKPARRPAKQPAVAQQQAAQEAQQAAQQQALQAQDQQLLQEHLKDLLRTVFVYYQWVIARLSLFQ
jgi:hypothetical protein